MKSAAIGAVLALCAMAGTIHAAEIPNMVGTWKPSGASAGGRVGHAHVVDRIDQATGEEVCPVAVYDGPGKEWVLRMNHPVHKQIARIDVRPWFDRGAVERKVEELRGDLTIPGLER